MSFLTSLIIDWYLKNYEDGMVDGMTATFISFKILICFPQILQ